MTLLPLLDALIGRETESDQNEFMSILATLMLLAWLVPLDAVKRMLRLVFYVDSDLEQVHQN